MAAHHYADRAAFSRLVALEHGASRDVSDAAALIAYHDRLPGGDTARASPSSSAAALPPWARAAQRIASTLHGVLPTVLITNAQLPTSSLAFSRVIRANLLQLSRLDPSIPPRAMCGLKLTALLHGWQLGALPERVLLLDHDVIVLQPQLLTRMLDPLRFYDLSGVMEGLSRGWDGRNPNQRNDSLALAPDAAGRGWEVNTGVLGVRKQAEWFVRLWEDEFRAGARLYSRLTGVDQSALMWVLAHEPRARLFPMPPSYNFRQPTLYSKDLSAPVAFHSRTATRTPSRSASIKAMAHIAHAVGEQANGWQAGAGGASDPRGGARGGRLQGKG